MALGTDRLHFAAGMLGSQYEAPSLTGAERLRAVQETDAWLDRVIDSLAIGLPRRTTLDVLHAVIDERRAVERLGI